MIPVDLAIRVAIAAELRATHIESRAKAHSWDGPEYMKDQNGTRRVLVQGLLEALRSSEPLSVEMQVAMADSFGVQVDALVCRFGQEFRLSHGEIDAIVSQILVRE